MQKQTGNTYVPSRFAKSLCVSEAKIGKTTYLASAALGCLPWQKQGGIVDKPENLAIFSLDAGAAAGISRFLAEICGAPKEALNYTIYNLESDLRAVATSTQEYDNTFYNALVTALRDFAQTANKGVSVCIASSLTGFAEGIKRGISGPPNTNKKSPMDQNKWDLYGAQMSEIRNLFQKDDWHTLWEGHIIKDGAADESKNDGDKIAGLQGSVGKNFPYNVEQVFRIRRNFGMKFEKTKCEQVYLDTRASLSFISGGRCFSESLEEKEPDLASALNKLGKKVGGWNSK